MICLIFRCANVIIFTKKKKEKDIFLQIKSANLDAESLLRSFR